MADKYIRKGTGSADFQEVEATTTSTGAAEAGDLVGLDAGGKLDNSLFPAGIGDDTKLIEASENLAGGDFINVFDDAGTVKVRKADATTTGKEAVGFVTDAVTSGNNATVFSLGVINDSLSALTLAAIYYLATTAGGVTTTRPSTSGNIVQRLGRSVSATEIMTESHPTIEVA